MITCIFTNIIGEYIMRIYDFSNLITCVGFKKKINLYLNTSLIEIWKQRSISVNNFFFYKSNLASNLNYFEKQISETQYCTMHKFALWLFERVSSSFEQLTRVWNHGWLYIIQVEYQIINTVHNITNITINYTLVWTLRTEKPACTPFIGWPYYGRFLFWIARR